MITFFGFVIVVIMLFWIASINNRLHSAEKEIRTLQADKTPVAITHMPQPLSASISEASQPLPAGMTLDSTAALKQTDLRKTSSSEQKEVEIASGWLNKIGVLALLFGVAFFLKLAIDRGWISQWGRVILGLAAGGLFLILGEIWKDKYNKYAAALTGGGIALLYFSIFAAFQFYNLLPQAVAFTIMIVISVIGVSLAFRYKSKPLAILGIAGSYLSPILMQNGMDQQMALFIYVTLLNVATIVVLAKYYWMEFAVLSFFGAVADFALWAIKFSTVQNAPASMVFAFLIFSLFLLGGAIFFRVHKNSGSLSKDSDKNFAVLAILAGVFFIIAAPLLFYVHYHDYLGLVGLLGGIVAFVAYILLDRLEFKNINFSLSLIGSVLFFAALVWYFSGSVHDFLIIILGIFGVGIGVLLKRPELRVWGLAILIIAMILVLFKPYSYSNYVFILNAKFGLMFVESMALLVAGWFYDEVEEIKEEKNAGSIARVCGAMLLWLAFSWELVTYFRAYDAVNTRNLVLSLWWIFYGLILMVVGAVSGSKIFRQIAIVLFGFSIVKVFLYDVQALDLAFRVVSFIVLGVILLTVSFAYQKNKEKFNKFLEGERTKNI